MNARDGQTDQGERPPAGRTYDVAGCNATKARAGRRGSAVIMRGLFGGHVDLSKKELVPALSCEPKWYTLSNMRIQFYFDRAITSCAFLMGGFPCVM